MAYLFDYLPDPRRVPGALAGVTRTTVSAVSGTVAAYTPHLKDALLMFKDIAVPLMPAYLMSPEIPLTILRAKVGNINSAVLNRVGGLMLPPDIGLALLLLMVKLKIIGLGDNDIQKGVTYRQGLAAATLGNIAAFLYFSYISSIFDIEPEIKAEVEDFFSIYRWASILQSLSYLHQQTCVGLFKIKPVIAIGLATLLPAYIAFEWLGQDSIDAAAYVITGYFAMVLTAYIALFNTPEFAPYHFLVDPAAAARGPGTIARSYGTELVNAWNAVIHDGLYAAGGVVAELTVNAVVIPALCEAIGRYHAILMSFQPPINELTMVPGWGSFDGAGARAAMLMHNGADNTNKRASAIVGTTMPLAIVATFLVPTAIFSQQVARYLSNPQDLARVSADDVSAAIRYSTAIAAAALTKENLLCLLQGLGYVKGPKVWTLAVSGTVLVLALTQAEEVGALGLYQYMLWGFVADIIALSATYGYVTSDCDLIGSFRAAIQGYGSQQDVDGESATISSERASWCLPCCPSPARLVQNVWGDNRRRVRVEEPAPGQDGRRPAPGRTNPAVVV